MSRGPGRIEREILDMAESRPLLVSQIARKAYRLELAREVTPTHRQAVRRALRKLEQAGVVARSYDEQLGRWRWHRVNIAAAERDHERRARELRARRRAEDREAAIAAANANSPGAVVRLGERPGIVPGLSHQTQAVWLDERQPPPPRVRITRRRSQRPGGPRSIGTLWAYDVRRPEPSEISAVIAVIARLWAGLLLADRALALQLLDRLPTTKIAG